MKHVDSEIIHAFADGKEIQWKSKKNQDLDWQDLDKECALFETNLRQYRIKPDAPKWPKTTMTQHELWCEIDNVRNAPALEVFANMVIARACEEGALVPADKVLGIEAKARAEGKRDAANPVRIIEAAWNHMKLGRLDPETIQIILMQAAK